jgi:chromosome segregation ATPase
MGYGNPWPGIMARKQRDEVEARAHDLERQLTECHQEVERLRARITQLEREAKR